MTLVNEFVNAIKRGDCKTVESMLGERAVDANVRVPSPAVPALTLAAWCGRTAIVKSLLRAGAHIDAVDESGMTACHTAAERNHEEVLAALLAHRPDLTLKDARQRTPFEATLREPCMTLLVRAGAPLDNPHRLCQLAAMSTAAIQALLSRGVRVTELRGFGQSTPLHFAVAIGKPPGTAVLDMLVGACRIDVDSRDGLANTCLMFAASHGCDEKVAWLIAVAGADVNAVNNIATTALHGACLNGHFNSALLLVAAGANACSGGGCAPTPCHLVASAAFRDTAIAMRIVHLMCAAGADLDLSIEGFSTVRRLLAGRGLFVEDEKVELARKLIATTRIDFVRERASQVCIGLQSLRLDALQMCEILVHACGGPMAPLIPFHIWWAIATTVKHFAKQKETFQSRL